MLLTLHLYARQDDVTITVPRHNLSHTWPNVIALNKDTTRVVAVGETPAMMQQRHPEDWDRHAGQLVFRPAFDPAHFEPLLAEAFVRYATATVHHQLHPHFWSLWWAITRFTGTVYITDYDQVAVADQQHFTRLLRQRPQYRRLSVMRG